ncbi:MAG: hypothetical protein C4295_04855, partial [Candidatus Fervidibacterota bacterium]
ERGKEIWEGFTLEGIPFLLEGDEGQWVLINHPKPPKGFVRYKGPLPKVPFRMTVYVGEGKEPRERREEWGGWAEKVNGVWTAALRYFPNWWALQDCAPPGYTVIRQPDAAYRLETVIHEAFHVWWFQRVGEPNLQGREKKGQAITVEWAERECLARALEAEKEEEKRLWVKAFLEERKRRRILEGANEAEVNAERWEETVEGTATFVGWRAMQEGKAKDYQPLSLLEADDAFYGYHSSLDKPSIIEVLRKGAGKLGKSHAIGLAQVLLLTTFKVNDWKRELMVGKKLEDLLEKQVNNVTISPNLLIDVERSVEKALQQAMEKTIGLSKEAKPPQPFVAIWVSLPVEVVRAVRELEKILGNPLPALHLSSPEMSVQINPPVWVVMDESNKRVGILWDANKQLMVLHRPDGKRALRGDGLEVSGKIEVTWNEKGVHVRPENETQKPKGSALAMVRKKGWYAVVLPVALLVNAIAGQTVASAQEESLYVDGTLVGLFYNLGTGEFQYAELSLGDPAVANFGFIDEEEVTLYLTAFRSEGSVLYRTDAVFYITLSFSTENWEFQGVSLGWSPRVVSGPQSGRDKLNVEVTVGPGGSVTGKVTLIKPDGTSITIIFTFPSVPPPGSVAVATVLGDCEKEPGEWWKERIAAKGEIWRRKEPKKRYRFSSPGQVVLEKKIPPADDYTGKAVPLVEKGTNLACLGPVTPQPVPFDVQSNAVSYIFFIFWKHKGVKGLVRVETPFVISEPVRRIAEVRLARPVKQGEIPDFEIVNEDGTRTGYKTLASGYADKNIIRGKNWVEAEFFVPYPDPKGGGYDLFVFLIADSFPIPSDHRWDPRYGWRYVYIPECQYSRPLSKPDDAHDSSKPCNQSVSKDVGLVVTFRPVEGNNDGSEAPIRGR